MSMLGKLHNQRDRKRAGLVLDLLLGAVKTCLSVAAVLPKSRAGPNRASGSKTSEDLIIFGVRPWKIDRFVGQGGILGQV